jgi:hypothetical protein
VDYSKDADHAPGCSVKHAVLPYDETAHARLEIVACRADQCVIAKRVEGIVQSGELDVGLLLTPALDV